MIANQVRPQWLPDRSVVAAAGGRVDAERIPRGLAAAGLDLPADVIDGLVAETVEHARQVHGRVARARAVGRGAGPPPLLELPRLIDGVDLGVALRAGRGVAHPGCRSHGGRPMSIDDLLDDPATRVIVCCGSGGVGKTTTSAALAIRAAERGRTVVVLTIDPAKRLAQAMGLTMLGNEPQLVAEWRRSRDRAAACTR